MRKHVPHAAPYCNLCVPQRLQEQQKKATTDINQNNIASFALHLLYHWNSSEDVSTGAFEAFEKKLVVGNTTNGAQALRLALVGFSEAR